MPVRFKKGNTTGFKKGCKPYMRSKEGEEKSKCTSNESVYIRPEAKVYDLAVHKPFYGLRPQEASEGGQKKILRPRTSGTQGSGNSFSLDDYER